VAGPLVAGAAGLIGLQLPRASPAVDPVVLTCRGGVCDRGKDPSTARESRTLQPVVVWGRKIELHVSYLDGVVAWASIGNGTPRDPVWLDRTFDGGASWEQHLDLTSIPAVWTTWRTRMYWINDVSRTGLVRACERPVYPRWSTHCR
jgi:hypothetical protein